MSYPHGRGVDVDQTSPRAQATCDRCGAHFNHHKLRWQWDWQGPRLQNKRILVCSGCLDRPQMNGNRTILIPADPIPVMNPRPEQYVPDNNPLSGIAQNPNPTRWQYGSLIGNMTDGGGVPAAFSYGPNKPDFQSAMKSTPNSSYNNYVGVNWAGQPATLSSSNLNPPVITHTVTSYTITAPNNATFGSTAYLIQGSPIGGAGYGGWTTISSGNPVGSIGEKIFVDVTSGGRFQFTRVAFLAPVSGGSIAVAHVEFNVSDGSSAGVE